MSEMELREYGRRNDRVYRECIGVVETEGKDDPKKLLLVQVRVFGVFDDVPVKDLPWAEYKLPIGARVNDGSFTPVRVGDYVYVDFMNGDTRRPRITGSVHYAPDKVPNLPHETFAGADAYVHKRTGIEPPQPAHNYGEDTVFTHNGFMIALNRDGSANFTQKGTGSEITFTKSGDVIFHTEGDVYRSATGDSISQVNGDERKVIMKGLDVLAIAGINLDGGTGESEGVVTGGCNCAYTGKPHPHVSLTVKASS